MNTIDYLKMHIMFIQAVYIEVLMYGLVNNYTLSLTNGVLDFKHQSNIIKRTSLYFCRNL